MSESKVDNWYFLFKSYHQVNHLSTNRSIQSTSPESSSLRGADALIFSALVSPAEKIAGETRPEKSVCFPQAEKSVMVRTCDRAPQKFVDASSKTVIFLALDISKN